MSEIEHYIGVIMADGCGEEDLIGLVDGEPTGHIARVTVELDRFDRDLVEAYKHEQAKR